MPRRRLLAAVSGLLLSALAVMGTSTLAWWVAAATVRLNDISIGYDEKSFNMAYIDGDELRPSNDGTIEFSDDLRIGQASSMFLDDWYKPEELDVETMLPSFYSAYQSPTANRRTTIAKAGSEYINLEFEISSDDDVYIYLNENSFLQANHGDNEYAASSMEDGVSAEILDNCVNAVRVSFLSNMGFTIFDPGKELDGGTYLGGRLDNQPNDGYWDYTEDGREVLYGEYDDSVIPELEYSLVEEENAPGDMHNGFDAVSKKGNYALSEAQLTSLKTSGRIAKERSYSLSDLSVYAENKHPICFVPKGESTRLVMSIYAEGWDVDCINAILSASMSIHLEFDGYFAPYGRDGYVVIS